MTYQNPFELRAACRAGWAAPTSGHATGFTQCNLIALPTDWAWDFLLFAQRNPKPCPVLDVTEPGGFETALAPAPICVATCRATASGATARWPRNPPTRRRSGPSIPTW